MEVLLIFLVVVLPLLVAFFLARGVYYGIRRRREGPLALTISIITFLSLLLLMGVGLALLASMAFER